MKVENYEEQKYARRSDNKNMMKVESVGKQKYVTKSGKHLGS